MERVAHIAESMVPVEPAPTCRPDPKILAVDDVRPNLKLMEALLADMKCELVRAESGREALQLLEEHDFALMLLDVQMPDMDGYEVAQRAREKAPRRDLPILFLTAEDRDDRSVLRGYGSGAVDFLYKPIQRDVLRGKVRVFLELYRSRREVADARDALERSNIELLELAASKALLAEQSERAKLELMQAYQDLKTTQAQLVQAAKMASLGELVAGVAHEINNPLSFSISHLATVQRSLSIVAAHPAFCKEQEPDWQRSRERLRAVDAGLERIRSLVLKLQTFSRFDEGACEAVNVAECVDSVLTILQHRFQGRIHIQTRFRDPKIISCDPSLINQGVMNLVNNAIDAIPGLGSILIATGAEGDDYVLRVQDSGRGIPSAIRERIFEPFFTTKSVGEGTGLGLSITYSIVRRHGGTLEVRACPEGGTEAILRIPMAGRQS
jgi:two-component system, NtrC family, sensor kinase